MKQRRTQVDRERDARARDTANHLRHIAELQAERRRALVLGREDIRLLIAQFGPVLWDLILVARAGVDAADPTRGAPSEDTSRASVPSSERTEGSSTAHYRRTLEAFRRKLTKDVADFASQLGAQLVDHRAFSAHVRWHLSEDVPTSECDYCILDPRLSCAVAGCDQVRHPSEEHCRKHRAA